MTLPLAISDSANFNVSAERIFDPSLQGVPVIVLTNNDGCALARSGDAIHSSKQIVSYCHVRFSSNVSCISVAWKT